MFNFFETKLYGIIERKIKRYLLKNPLKNSMKGDIIKLKDYASYPGYTYLILDEDIEVDFEAGKINKEDGYIRILNLTRCIEPLTAIEKQMGGRNNTSYINRKSIDKVLLNILK